MQYLEFIVYVLFVISIFSFLSLAPWMPTRGDDLERIQDITKLMPGEKFLEMGCGTAKVSLYMARKHPNSQIVGIELSPFFYLVSKLKVLFLGGKNIKIIYGNALKMNLEEFDVIYIFGLPESIAKKVFPRLRNIKKKNFRFISYCFQMKNDYFKEIKHKPENKYAIYEYKIQ